MESTTNNTQNPTTQPEDRLKSLKGQLEYYLSDENLKKDKFFHEKISTDSEGYLDAELILNCNKIKQVGATLEEILSAAQLSEELEVSGNRLRRAGNKALPELKLLNKKTKRKDSAEGEGKEEEDFDPVILAISSDKEPEFRWKAIQDHFRDTNTNLKVKYLRFNSGQGHIGCFNTQPELKFTEKFEIEGVNFEVKKCEGDDLISFWKDHGSHFEMCIGRNKKFEKGGRGKDRREKRDMNYLKNAVTLGDESFTDVGKIRARARRILTTTVDGQKIPSPDHEFLLDLLKHHRNSEDKVRELAYFTPGKPKEHDYSRCFFAVKSDETREDFSVHKCVERISIENKKKKN